MALFKINRGPESTLDSIPVHDGYAYFTEDLHNLYIDVLNSNTGEVIRVQVNAYFAEELRKVSEDGTVEYIAFDDIQLKSTIQDVVHGGTGHAILTPNSMLIGNGVSAIKTVTISNDNFVVGDTDNGVKGISAEEARTKLDVYSKDEIDTKVENAGGVVAYNTILSKDNWSLEDGVQKYIYSNSALKCGKNEDVPPIICLNSSNVGNAAISYSQIVQAIATQGLGIIFITGNSDEVVYDIPIIIIDHV